ncbi:DUF3784 domain-containing protein [Imperialibacter roseus]|uniref:DUF3784 domain-containing protein n=1 Tax=Imperialibacter roseus TaxID=1324217 RepID=A0ABZ0IPI7_9BACT|nr:DUF3784 domain-containing protein [Imperialibacter roseus]WOK06963.1 DUF3784 domain-containing protein [Imperialibacter roseus]
MGQLVHLIIGTFLIGTGFLVKSYPMLIAGYNTMPEDKRKNVDVDGLSSMIRNHFITMGLVLVVGAYLFLWLGWKNVADSWPIVSIMCILPFTLIQAQRFDHNKTSPTKLLSIAAFVVIFTFGTFFFLHLSIQPPEFAIDGNQLQISGLFGTTVTIENANLNDAIGKIELKTNGFHMGEVYKGHFQVQGMGECLLFLQSTEGPFILIHDGGKETIVLNQASGDATRNRFDKLNKGM